MSQLVQLIGYLERPGVTEVIIGVGRPIAMRNEAGVSNLTARPITTEQLASMVRGSPIENMIPDEDSTTDPVDIQVGARRVRVQVGRRGGEVLVRLSRTDETPPSPVVTQPMARVAQPRAGTQRPIDELRPPRPPAEPEVKFKATAPLQKEAAPGISMDAISLDFQGELEISGVALPPPRMKSNTAQGLADGPAPARRARTPSMPLAPLTGFELDLDPIDPPAPPSGSAIDVDAPTEAPGAGFSMPSAMVLEDVGYGAPAAEPYAPPPPPPPPPPNRLPIPVTSPVPQGAFADLVKAARDHGASDLHVSAGRVTAMRLGSDLVPLGNAPLSAPEAEALLLPLLDAEMRQTLEKVGYVDFALGSPGAGRLRVNICRQQLGLKGTFRLAMREPASLEQLGLPSDLARVVSHHQGLVIVAGPSGHGKTTTLAALVDLVNSTRQHHILTIEDPVEIIHTRKLAVISQREVGRHTVSFARGLKASLREDPDVIVIGELRDRESVEIALTAAETGHLVLATMSTPSAAKTIDRLIDMFPPEEHSQVRASVAGALRAIVAQRLLPRKGGHGVVPAVELVTGVLPLAVMIREDKLYQLPNLMQRGRAFGMIRLEDSIAELIRLGRIEDEAKTQPMWRTPK